VQIEGCEKLTKVNIIIAYDSLSKNASVETKFYAELYGTNKNGLLYKIPNRKLAEGVIEFPQRNIHEITTIFTKHAVGYQLRLTIPITDPKQIAKISAGIEDPYEKALTLDSIGFSKFVEGKLKHMGKEPVDYGDLLNEFLAVTDTVQKWLKNHKKEIKIGFTDVFETLATVDTKSSMAIQKEALRSAKSLRQWIVKNSVQEGGKDKLPIGKVLKKYRRRKPKILR